MVTFVAAPIVHSLIRMPEYTPNSRISILQMPTFSEFRAHISHLASLSDKLDRQGGWEKEMKIDSSQSFCEFIVDSINLWLYTIYSRLFMDVVTRERENDAETLLSTIPLRWPLMFCRVEWYHRMIGLRNKLEARHIWARAKERKQK